MAFNMKTCEDENYELTNFNYLKFINNTFFKSDLHFEGQFWIRRQGNFEGYF